MSQTKTRDPLAYEQLVARCMGNIDFAQRILAKFLVKFDEDLDRLRQGVAAGDAELVALTAHRLKGSSANVAATELAKVVGDIEHLARACQWPLIEDRLQSLEQEWSRVEQHARSLAASPPSLS